MAKRYAETGYRHCPASSGHGGRENVLEAEDPQKRAHLVDFRARTGMMGGSSNFPQKNLDPRHQRGPVIVLAKPYGEGRCVP